VNRYLLRIHNNNTSKVKFISINTQNLLQNYYGGAANELAEILNNIYTRYKDRNLTIIIENSKREPITRELRRGIGIFKNTNELI
jgi:hypothetical protein